MPEFENELNKEPYELFVDLVHNEIANNTTCNISLHTLKKLGYLQGNANIKNKLNDLIQLASSYDTDGVYKVLNTHIEYTKIIPVNEIGISYIYCNGTKEERHKKCYKDFNYTITTFKDLIYLLKDDYAYCPFEFKEGKRSNANITSKCKWLALDIDKSLFTDEEQHEIFQNINHYIVRTSDKNNPYKFRILFELDTEIDLDEISWRKFLKSIAYYYNLTIDVLPKSQIFYSYSDRNILSVTDKEPIGVREHLIYAYNDSKLPSELNLSKTEKRNLLDNPLTTFFYAYEAKVGEGSLSLIRASKHAKDLGATREEVISLVKDINTYWVNPLDEVRLQKTIVSQIQKWDF